MISGVPGGIRARLRGVHRLTISLSSVLFVETDPSALSIAATVCALFSEIARTLIVPACKYEALFYE